MKRKNYILPLLIAALLLAGAVDSSLQGQNKLQSSSLMSVSRTIEFTAYINGQDFHIDFNDAVNSALTVELYNITGARIADWKVEKSAEKFVELSLNRYLNKGLYIVKVTAGQQVVAKKIQI
jgi:methionine-rich copper-binding protein CopC